jgi:hypothetical protein
MSDLAGRLSEFEYGPLHDEACPSALDWPRLLTLGAYRLPDDYRQFLEAFPQTGFFDKEVILKTTEATPWSDDGFERLELLYGWCSIPSQELAAVRESYITELPSRYLVIGEVAGSKHLCIDLSGHAGSTILLWDPSSRFDGTMDLYAAAPSFTAMIAALQDEHADVLAASARVVSMEVSDDFMAELAALKEKERQRAKNVHSEVNVPAGPRPEALVSELEGRFSALGYRAIEGDRILPSFDPMVLLEGTQFHLPVTYVAFLRAFPRTGSFTEEVVYPVVRSTAGTSFERLGIMFGASNRADTSLEGARSRYLGQLHPRYFVIGESVGSNAVCIDLDEGAYGRVVEWDRSSRFKRVMDFFPVAESFDAFVASLRKGGFD